MDITSPTNTAAAAAYAARMPMRAFRHCSADMPMLGQPDRRHGDWRRFGLIDVVRVAIAGRAFTFGLTAHEAAEMVDYCVDRYVSGMADCGIELPASFLLRRLHRGVAMATRDADGRLEFRTAEAPEITADASLVLRLGDVAADALARLAEYQNTARVGGATGEVLTGRIEQPVGCESSNPATRQTYSSKDSN